MNQLPNNKKMELILLVILTSIKGGWGVCLDHFNQGRTSLNGYTTSVNSYSCLRFDLNSISVIPSGLFYGTITTYFNMDSNALTTAGIPHDAFNRMTSLQTIHLQHMSLTVVKNSTYWLKGVPSQSRQSSWSTSS